MAYNKALQNFKATASDEEWAELAELIKAAKNRKQCLQTDKYPFSYSSIAPDLEKRGLIEIDHKQESRPDTASAKLSDAMCSGFPSLIISGEAPGETNSRTVQLYPDVYNRLRTCQKANWMYTKTAILNQIIRDGLSKYGF